MFLHRHRHQNNFENSFIIIKMKNVLTTTATALVLLLVLLLVLVSADDVSLLSSTRYHQDDNPSSTTADTDTTASSVTILPLTTMMGSSSSEEEDKDEKKSGLVATATATTTTTLSLGTTTSSTTQQREDQSLEQKQHDDNINPTKEEEEVVDDYGYYNYNKATTKNHQGRSYASRSLAANKLKKCQNRCASTEAGGVRAKCLRKYKCNNNNEKSYQEKLLCNLECDIEVSECNKKCDITTAVKSKRSCRRKCQNDIVQTSCIMKTCSKKKANNLQKLIKQTNCIINTCYNGKKYKRLLSKCYKQKCSGGSGPVIVPLDTSTCEAECTTTSALLNNRQQQQQCMEDYCNRQGNSDVGGDSSYSGSPTQAQCTAAAEAGTNNTTPAATVNVIIDNQDVQIPLYSCGATGTTVSILPSSTTNTTTNATANSTTDTTVALTKSKLNYACILFKKKIKKESVGTTSTSTIAMARSYDNNNWEKASVAPMSSYIHPTVIIVCSEDQEQEDFCVVELPPITSSEQDEHEYEYKLLSVSHALTEKQAISRFLAQSTFGPTMSEINSFPSGALNYKKWVMDQMNPNVVPATYHREYYRRRTNQHAMDDSATIASRDGCDNNSRWHQFAFTTQDHGRIITLSTTSNTKKHLILMDNIVLTEVDVGGRGPILPLNIEFAICEVTEEHFNGKILVAQGSHKQVCSTTAPKNMESFYNPYINFWTSNKPSADNMLNVSQKAIQLVKLAPPVPDVLLLSKKVSNAACLVTNAAKTTDILFSKDSSGRYYRHDSRMALLENTLDSPAHLPTLLPQNGLDKCPNPVPTFLNRDSCVIVQGDVCARSNSRNSNDQKYSLICGSPGEVSNDPPIGSRFPYTATGFRKARPWTEVDTSSGFVDKNTDQALWLMATLTANDQLRQRVAFALSGILVIGPNKYTPDGRAAYYDIFVRNAFGNYRDVLKTITYSPGMGMYLTYRKSVSYAYSKSLYRPDENYAREIMQLFTIGLVKLNTDGSVILDEVTGKPIATYDNDDIMSVARVWTGFVTRALRSNIPDKLKSNLIDPMRINSHTHDVFPKMGLDDGYIGDGYPLCIDLPPRAFLRKGSTYEFIGSSDRPSLPLDASSSPLYKVLCNAARDGGSCRYSPTVVLNENLDCNGIECNVDEVYMVMVSAAAYRYVRRPCVSLQFFNEGRSAGLWEKRTWKREQVCLDPREAGAGEVCCGGNSQPQKYCTYEGEVLTYSSAEQRCTDRGMAVCTTIKKQRPFCPTSCCHSTHTDNHLWTNQECQLKAKVSQDGQVAIVHDVKYPYGHYVSPNAKNWFRVGWMLSNNNSEVPNIESNQCGPCEKYENDCICNVTVTEYPVFNSIPSHSDVLSRLKVGNVEHDMYDEGTFLEGPEEGGVRVFHKAGGFDFDADTIFLVVDDFGDYVYLRNIESIVEIAGSQAKFRNPPSFLNIINHVYNSDNARYEVDALLDHLMKHQNIAPFISYRLIQRLVTSNPSPRYIETVAKAFRTGEYNGIGSGKNGDLAATVAAILLDPEARSVALDADPAHGQLREPVLKLVYALRSLEFKTFERELQIEFRVDLGIDIGQMVHRSPSVFSYFLPEYSPSGSRVWEGGLVAPESQVMTTSTAIRFMNGLLSLGKFGLSSEENGFGRMREIVADTTRKSSVVVNELDMLLTNGRLSEEERSTISAAYHNVLKNGGKEAALRYALQLFFMSPSFHISNVHKRLCSSPNNNLINLSTPASGSPAFPNKMPKTIVFVSLDGGADSYNMLVPHSYCGTVDLYQEYSTARGSIAIAKNDLLQINAVAGTQPCEKFGMHPNLKAMHKLYKDGDLLWFANAGSLVLPPGANFAHNHMKQILESADTAQSPAGILGRMADVLTAIGYKTGSYSIKGRSRIQEKNVTGSSPQTDFLNLNGIELFSSETSLGGRGFDNVVKEMLLKQRSSIFGDTWTSTMARGISRASFLKSVSESEPLKANTREHWNTLSQFERQLKQVSKLMAGHKQLGTDRNTFSVTLSGFDAHNDIVEQLDIPLIDLDASLSSYVAEMKAQDLWDHVVVVVSSEFGRTLSSNGEGTDHGHGGNYFIMGGGVKGGRILGNYPKKLTGNDNGLLMKRGRVVPTTPWESIWTGIAQWYDIPDDRLDETLPLRPNFNTFYTKEDLFN